jgi:hypothetical protein
MYPKESFQAELVRNVPEIWPVIYRRLPGEHFQAGGQTFNSTQIDVRTYKRLFNLR